MPEDFFDIHQMEIEELARRFSSYTLNHIDEYKIRQWIRQFNVNDFALALNVLRNVIFYDPRRVALEFQHIHQLLLTFGIEMDKTYFPYFERAGESSESLLPIYRNANHIDPRRMIYLSQLSEATFDQPRLNFVLVNDFVGSGKQVIDKWREIGSLILPENKVYLLIICGYEDAIRKIETETRITVVTTMRLSDRYKIFHDSCDFFTEQEKKILLDYCRTADDEPEGFGNCQSLVVFFHRCPNNTISILRSTINWNGLFPRFPPRI
jgi:hypothetical protein